MLLRTSAGMAGSELCGFGHMSGKHQVYGYGGERLALEYGDGVIVHVALPPRRGGHTACANDRMVQYDHDLPV